MGWQQDMHYALTFVECEGVETGTGHDKEENICKISTWKYEQLNQSDMVNANSTWPAGIAPRLYAWPDNCKSTQNSHWHLEHC